MYGSSKQIPVIDPKEKANDPKQRLQAIYEFKKQMDKTSSDIEQLSLCLNDVKNKLQQTDDQIKTLWKAFDDKDDIKNLLATMQDELTNKFVEVESKMQNVTDEIYENIESYIANATPRNNNDLQDLKDKVMKFETKIDLLDKSLNVSSNEKPKPKLIRPNPLTKN